MVAHGHPLVGQGGHPHADGGGGQMEAAAGPLLCPGDEVGGQPALLRGLLDDGPVVAGDAQHGGQPLADQAASAAEASGETPVQGQSAETKPGPAEQTEEASPAAADTAYQEYVVKNGDTLSLICKEHYGKGTPALVAEVCRFNGMANANLIYEGQVLKLPEE